MAQQVAKGDVSLSVHAEVVEETRHPVVESDLPFFDHEHHGDGGGERLGERGDVEDRIFAHRAHLRLQAAVAEGAMVEYPRPLPYQKNGAGKDMPPEGGIHLALNGFEA